MLSVGNLEVPPPESGCPTCRKIWNLCNYRPRWLICDEAGKSELHFPWLGVNKRWITWIRSAGAGECSSIQDGHISVENNRLNTLMHSRSTYTFIQ